MHDFRKLEVWIKSKELSLSIYKITQNFPANEVYGLTNQIRRSCISISSNIAEGSGRNSDKDFLRFLNIALGSSYELDSQLEIAFDLNFITGTDYQKLNDELIIIKKMLYNFISHLKSKY